MKRSKHISPTLFSSLCIAVGLMPCLNSYATEHLLAPSHSDVVITQEQTAPLYLLAQAASSKAEAARIAKSRHGGKVLSVRKSGNGWQVKLLQDDGRVKLVYVEGGSK